eukprot:3586542-Pleurochrysis_carterae.AAC.1
MPAVSRSVGAIQHVRHEPAPAVLGEAVPTSRRLPAQCSQSLPTDGMLKVVVWRWSYHPVSQVVVSASQAQRRNWVQGVELRFEDLAQLPWMAMSLILE